MITNKFLYVFHVSLICLIVFGSCSTHKQVACPPYEQNKHLARESNRVKYKIPTKRSRFIASNIKNLKARKQLRQYKEINLSKPTVPDRALHSEFNHIDPIEGSLDFYIPVQENLIVSSNLTEYYGSASDITRITRSNEKVEKAISIPTIDLDNRKEQRKVSQELKKDLRKSLRSIQNETQQATVKPAQGLAVASMVLGIVSFFIFGIPAGTLAVIFGGIALSRIQKNPTLKGKGMAIAGLVCGIVGVIGAIYVIAFVL